MTPQPELAPWQTTGIGSMPQRDPHEAARLIASHTTLPYWPQLAALGAGEDMVIQAAWGLPCLEVDLEARRVVARAKEREEALTRFYEHLLAADVDYFAPPESPGLDALLQGLAGREPAWLKGQVAGPVTFGTTVKDEAGRDLIHDRELMEACCQGLAMKALWQAKRFEERGARAVIFFDEPSLSALGSAFMAVERQGVAQLLGLLFETVRAVSPEVVLGVHCCGNSDWPLLLSSGADIISFDSWSYLDNFCLFPREIGAHLARGGMLAWGAVPTLEPVPGDWNLLLERLQGGLARLTGAGVDGSLLRGRSLLTPSCGLGTLSEEGALQVLEALGWLRGRLLA